LLTLWARVDPNFKERACETAAKLHKFSLIKGLRDSFGCILTDAVLFEAAVCSNKEMITYCINNGIRLSSKVLNEAVANHSWSIMQWLMSSKDCPFDDESFSTFIMTGNIEKIDWAYQRKCPFDTKRAWAAFDLYKKGWAEPGSVMYRKGPRSPPRAVEAYILGIAGARPVSTEQQLSCSSSSEQPSQNNDNSSHVSHVLTH